MKSVSYFIIAICLLAALAYGLSAQTGSRTEAEVKPIVAAQDSLTYTAWLHVEVETSWGWFWQKSVGRAYATIGKDSKQKVKVGLLCVRLDADKHQEVCLPDADSVGVSEKVNGLGVPKITARVRAWAERPSLGPDSVSLNP